MLGTHNGLKTFLHPLGQSLQLPQNMDIMHLTHRRGNRGSERTYDLPTVCKPRIKRALLPASSHGELSLFLKVSAQLSPPPEASPDPQWGQVTSVGSHSCLCGPHHSRVASAWPLVEAVGIGTCARTRLSRHAVSSERGAAAAPIFPMKPPRLGELKFPPARNDGDSRSAEAAAAPATPFGGARTCPHPRLVSAPARLPHAGGRRLRGCHL